MGVASTEIVIESPGQELLNDLKSYGGYAVRTGDRVRVEIPKESDVPAVLGKILQAGTRIVSVNPIKMSLEDYFLAQVAKDTRESGGKERIAQSIGER